MTQRRHEVSKDLQAAWSKEPYKVWLPHAQPEFDRRRNKTASGHLESADERYTTQRDGEGKHRSSRSSKADGFGVGASYYTIPTSSSKTPIPTTRPPSRNAATPRPPHPTAQPSPVPQPRLQSRSVLQQQRWQSEIPEVYDLRAHLHKRSPAVPSPKSSYEQVSGPEDGTRVPHHLRSRSGAGTPTPTALNVPGQDLSSRRHTEKGNDRERERHRERGSDRPEKYSEKEKIRPETKQRERDKIREDGRAKERVKYVDRDRERRPQGEHERPLRPITSSRDLPRTEDPDSSDSGKRRRAVAPSRHRRYRTEEGTQSTSADRRQHLERSQHATSTLSMTQVPPGTSNTTVLNQPLPPTHPPISTNTGVRSNDHIPPTPRVTPVYLPGKEAKAYRSHHDRSSSLPAELPTSVLSGSDTERVKRRELRHRTTNHANNLRVFQVENPQVLENRTLGASISRQPLNQSGYSRDVANSRIIEVASGRESGSRMRETLPSKAPDYRADIPLEVPPSATPFPVISVEKHRKIGCEIPQIVSIRAGQGPSDPQSSDALLKSSVLSKLEPTTYPSTVARPSIEIVRESSHQTRQTGLLPSHSHAQSSTTRGPVIDLQVSITPAFESSVSAPSHVNVAHLRESPSQSITTPIPTEVNTQSVLPPSRSTSRTAHLNEFSSSRPQNDIRGPSIVAQHSARSASYQNQLGHDEVHPEIAVSPQVPSNSTRPHRTSIHPVTLQGLSSHVTAQTPSYLLKLGGKESARAPVLPDVAVTSSTTSPVPTKDSFPAVLPSLSLASRAPPQVQLGGTGSLEYLTGTQGIAKPPPATPFEKIVTHQSDQKATQFVQFPAKGQEPTPDTTTSLLKHLPNDQPDVIPSTAKPIASLPDQGAQRIHPNPAQAETPAMQPVLNAITLERGEVERSEPCFTAESDVIVGDAGTKRLRTHVPQVLVSAPQIAPKIMPTLTIVPELIADRPAQVSSSVDESKEESFGKSTINASSQFELSAKHGQSKVSRGLSSTSKFISGGGFSGDITPATQDGKPIQVERSVVLETSSQTLPKITRNPVKASESTLVMTSAKHGVSAESGIQNDVPIFQSKPKPSVQIMFSASPAHSASLPIQPISAEASSNKDPVNGAIPQIDNSVVQKVSTPMVSTSAVCDRCEKTITPPFFIPPLQTLRRACSPTEISGKISPASGKVSQIIASQTIHSASTASKQDSLIENDNKSQAHTFSLPLALKSPQDLTKCPETLSKALIDRPLLPLQLSTTMLVDQETQAPLPPRISSLSPNVSPHLQVQHRLTDNSLVNSISLAAQASVPDPSLQHFERNDVQMKEQLQVKTLSTTVVLQGPTKELSPPFVITSPAGVIQESNLEQISSQPTSSSLSPTLQCTPIITSRLPSVIAQPEVTRFPDQSPVTQGTPSRLQSLTSASTDIAFPSPGSTSQPTPSPKQLVHGTNPTNIHTHPMSHTHEIQSLSHTAASTSPKLHGKLYRSSTYPEVSAAHEKTLNSSQSYARTPPSANSTQGLSQPQSSSSATLPHSSFSRLQDSSNGNHSTVPAAIQRPSSTLPISSTGTTPSESQDSSSRAREVTGYPNAPPSNPHRSGPSIYYHSSSLTSVQTQHNVSSTAPTAPLPLPQTATVRTPLYAGQRPQMTPHVASNTQLVYNSQTSTATRIPVSGYTLTPAVTKRPQLERSASAESESLLMTPSSLARSIPPYHTSSNALPLQPPQERNKKNNIFDIYKAKVPEAGSCEPPPMSKVSHRDELRSNSRSSSKVNASFVPDDIPLPTKALPSNSLSITVAVPTSSGRKSPGTMVFTPFRFLTSNRHRTMSTASLEAVDGTAANTVVGSPTASIYDQSMTLPPVRDPLVATREWRNKEEAELKGRGTARRRRPGVVFDVAEENPSEYRSARQFGR